MFGKIVERVEWITTVDKVQIRSNDFNQLRIVSFAKEKLSLLLFFSGKRIHLIAADSWKIIPQNAA